MGSIIDINPERLNSPEDFRAAIYFLLNAVESLHLENQELKRQNQSLLDENNRLKGGNVRPDFKSSKKSGDISSQGKERDKPLKDQNKEKAAEKRPIEIDRKIVVEMDVSQLPPDVVFKGYREYKQQDLSIKRDNKHFFFASYYSASERKSYLAPFPAGECEGHFGAGVKSLASILHHYGNVTESKLGGLLEGLGISISSGSISNLLKAGHGWSVAEQEAILQAGLEEAAPKQMDSTGNREKGVNKVTHIITSPAFSVFYTLGSKSRIDCLRALQGNPGKELSLQWHGHMKELWRAAGVKNADCDTVMKLLNKNGMEVLSIGAFEDLLANEAPGIYKKKSIVHSLSEAMALHYYRQQTTFCPLEVLLTDDAPEYRKIATHHALCWVHDARYYNKLDPRTDFMKDTLQTFKTAYWEFYRNLLDYKTLTASQQQEKKAEIRNEFDKLFGKLTCYGVLDMCIERTRNNKEKLLRVLDFPDLPLHNNAAELAARRVVRKRDISLHTMAAWGTQLRDAFLSIIETAQKLGVSAYQYINDRITKANTMTSLAQRISPGFSATF